MRRVSVVLGILLGVLTGVVVIAASYLGNQLAGLPFAPFNLFDFMTRVLPGVVVTSSVGLMITVISALAVGPTSQVGKLAEQSIALVQFAVLGGLYGGVLAVIGRRRGLQRSPAIGLGIGLVLSVAFILIVAYLGFPTAGPVASVLWLVVVFAAWGLALGWLLRGMYQVRAEESPGGGLSRREALYLMGTTAVALIAGVVGLRFALPKSSPAQPTGAATPTPAIAKTSGAAASPPEDVLAQRIEPAPGTRTEITPTAEFYRVDINTVPPSVDAQAWRLELSGLVDNPLSLTLDQIRARPAISQVITQSCISNPVGGDLISTALYTGTRLKDLLEEAKLRPDARALYIESTDGFYETVVMSDIMDERTLLVYAMNSEPLPVEHGFPLRIYIPNRYGMKQPKWILGMQAVADEKAGYWVDRGWSKEAVVRTTSVVDDVTVQKTGGNAILAGGIAYSGARGISKVEVQVDEGPWTVAELRVPPLGPLTWVQWRLETQAQKGNHTAGVRAYEGDGTLQVEAENSTFPNGATGIDTFSFSVW